MRYGLPYQGSKNKLAERIVALLPEATHLYDVFAGGCAITHAAILSGKWDCVHFSDTNDSVVLFKDCLEGNIPDGSHWVSREEFELCKDTNPYIRIIWSFSNNQRDYLYSRELEPYKKAVHEMIFAQTPNERRLKFKEVCKLMESVNKERYADHASMERSQGLHEDFGKLKQILSPNLQSAESHSRIVNLESHARLADLGSYSIVRPPFVVGGYEMRIADYRDIEILPDSVIYCDIPYFQTKGYRYDTFDHETFYDWACSQSSPVFISEYWMPEDRFECIAEFERRSTFSATNNNLRKIEKIYRPKCQM